MELIFFRLINNSMRILFNFLIGLGLFIYGINLFSKGLERLSEKRLKKILEKYTKTKFKGIILGTIITAIIQSSSLTMILALGLVNSSVISFSNSIGIMMGANLGTCITSFLVAFLNISNTNNFFFNPNNYIPFLLILGLFFSFKNHCNKSNILIGFALFMLGLLMMETSLEPIREYAWFKNLLLSLENPFLGILIGILITSIIQSSSATVAILQTISESNPLTYSNVIPIIMGENIGSCFTTLIASLGSSKNAKKVPVSHLLYNLIGTFIFFSIFYLLYLFSNSILNTQVNSLKIAIIHTLFNLFSILIFYPFTKKLEKLVNLLVK